MIKKFLSCISFIFIFICLFNFVTVNALDIYYEDEEGKNVQINDFRDTHGHWAHDQILKWGDYRIINGYNGNFMPNNNIIRGDLAIIIDRLLNIENQTYNYFTDLNNDDYFAASMLKCVAEGYINGIGNKQLNPRGNATREEVAVIFCRIFNIDTSYSGNTGFKDDSGISSWARSSVYALSKAGYLNGTPEGYVLPKNNITRAELITLLDNFADTYIPENQSSNNYAASSFISDFPKNIVVNREITLVNSSVGRDIYITRQAGGIRLNNTSVLGRVVCLAECNVSLSNSKISQIVLCNEKSTVTGITEDVYEIYVKERATESTLNDFPKVLILDPGVRVNIGSVMYENTTNRVKTYDSIKLKEDISEEQGYVTGGPLINKGTHKVDYENNLIIEDITITNGDTDVREVGIVWIENEKEEEPLIPTYNRNDGKKRYYGSTYGAFDFEIGKINDYCTYRLYVKDKDGLFGYSSAFTFEAYDYDIKMSVTEEEYPRSLRIDIEFEGDNIPIIGSVSVLSSENALYSDKLYTTSLSKYYENYVKDPIDETKYVRYTGIINVPSYVDEQDGEIVYEVPTSFGYYIVFSDGDFIREFPVLSNVIPDGADLVDMLNPGVVSLLDKKIVINDSKVKTNLVGVEEVGIAYKISSSNSMSSPEFNSSGWTRIAGGYNLNIKETYYFDTTILVPESKGNTFYVPYVKTSNGFYYGDVEKIENNWMGDENAKKIQNVKVQVLGSNAIITVTMNESGVNGNDFIYLGEKFGNVNIGSLEPYFKGNSFSVVLRNFNEDMIDIPLRVTTIDGLKSNIFNISVLKSKNELNFVDKYTLGEYDIYKFDSPNLEDYNLELKSVQIVNSNIYPNLKGYVQIEVPNNVEITEKKVYVKFNYYFENSVLSSKYIELESIFDLY